MNISNNLSLLSLRSDTLTTVLNQRMPKFLSCCLICGESCRCQVEITSSDITSLQVWWWVWLDVREGANEGVDENRWGLGGSWSVDLSRIMKRERERERKERERSDCRKGAHLRHDGLKRRQKSFFGDRDNLHTLSPQPSYKCTFARQTIPPFASAKPSDPPPSQNLLPEMLARPNSHH